ncbi:phosphotransferase [Sagittula salina]|uniref:Aminoglycoside phosphotransferase domain-containing protein n=1 Tax=Sagittula salina TaxID=2820268 RepID=A0A940S092_9RHOB|nr:phosphotransferase [Sagittula salina]MBP0481911.1 hypothetical protein [Sagittula salina]
MISRAVAEVEARAALRAMDLSDAPTPLFPERPPAQAQLLATETLVLKVYAPEFATRADAQARRQSEVSDQLTGTNRAPAILFRRATTLVMPRLSGPDLATLWRQGDRHIPTLAGDWLRAFHAPTLRKFPFRPGGHVAWLHRLSDEVANGARSIPDPTAFQHSLERTESLAASARRQKATRAVTHRDMTLSNLLHDGRITWGIDFENTHEDEPLRDLFTLALDLLTLASPDAEPDLAPLRAAYGDRHTAAPVRLFLQRCFSTWVWANTPGSPSQRQAIRLAMARHLLDSDALIL